MKIKLLMVVFLALMFVNASSIDSRYPPLFAKVTNVSQDDTLSIRNQPNHRSKKVGSIPAEAYIAIEKCEDIRDSKWCRIDQIPQQPYEGFHIGWVNARYLKSINRGYVNIVGEKNDCYYALECQDGKCTVVKEFDYNYETDTLSNLVLKQIRRDKLKPTSSFGAMSEDGDGYCTSGKYIDEHLKKQNQKQEPS